MSTTVHRDTALHNILDLCPSLGWVLVKHLYRQNVNLFVDGETIVSITRGDYSRGPTSNGNVLTWCCPTNLEYICRRYLSLNRYGMLTIHPPVVPLRVSWHGGANSSRLALLSDIILTHLRPGCWWTEGRLLGQSNGCVPWLWSQGRHVLGSPRGSSK